MLTPEDLLQLDNIYVRKDDCNDRHEKSDRELTEIRIQLAKINAHLSIQNKVMAFVAGGIGTLLIGAIGSLILK